MGRLKTEFWKDAAEHYARRITRWRPLEIVEVKDGDSSLPEAGRVAQEGRRLLAALDARDLPVIMDERGISLTSPRLARRLRDLDEGGRGRTCLVVGGAFGLDDEVRARAVLALSLGPLTLPHELARVVLLEQLYRAECILRNIPYHHGQKLSTGRIPPSAPARGMPAP